MLCALRSLLQKLTWASSPSFWVWSRETKAESSQKRSSCWSSLPAIKMSLLCCKMTSSSPEKRFWSILFWSSLKLLRWFCKASSEQAVVALVIVSCHPCPKLKVRRILKLISCSSLLLKLFGFSAASSISFMILSFCEFLSELAAGCWPCCPKLLWSLGSWEAILAEGFFFFFFFFLFLLAPSSWQAVVPKVAVFLACCSLRFSRGKLS